MVIEADTFIEARKKFDKAISVRFLRKKVET